MIESLIENQDQVAKWAGITVSIGLATYPEFGDTPKMLMAAADAALYEAKRSGRNRVVVSGASSLLISAIAAASN